MMPNELIEKNIMLSYSIAHKFNKSGISIDFDELVSICNLGLVKAANSFDESKGFKFSSYAYRIIENEVLMNLRKVRKHSNVTSLDKQLDYEDFNKISYVETVEDETVTFDELENKEFIRNMLNLVTDRERECIELRYFDDLKQREIASIIGASQKNVSYLINKALRKMHNACLKQGVI